jgi:protocatechuate 3,4-dioxygenase beta subunit
MTRRAFVQLASAALMSAAASRRLHAGTSQGLDKFTMPGTACKTETPTPAVAESATFRPGAPQKATLADPKTGGRKLILSGIVKGVVCGPVKGARLDFWQPDARGAYDMVGFALRGYQITDQNGRYRIETVVPPATSGRARHLSARVTAEGKPTLTTALFFPDESGNPKDATFRPELAMTITSRADGLAATFDFVLDA